MNLRKYTEEQLRDSVANSTSLAQVLKSLNVAAYGGNYETLKRAIKFYNLDTSHFKGQAWNRGLKHGPKRTIEDYFNGVPVKSHALRLRLIAEKIFSPICSSCNLTTWMNLPIPLELDHIDGDNKNNSLDNLRLLCPNCHAFTPTYRGKNKSGRDGGSRTRTLSHSF